MDTPFRTNKGTVLQIISLQGKDYLPVAQRLVWFREEHPDWSIETDLLTSTDQSAVAKATIKDATGRIIATAHKEESCKDFPRGHREKCETGAIGRALGLCGYGTQFEPEFDEGDRIVDAPATPKQSETKQTTKKTSKNNAVETPTNVPQPTKPTESVQGPQMIDAFKIEDLRELSTKKGWAGKVSSYAKIKYGTDKINKLTMEQAADLERTISLSTWEAAMDAAKSLADFNNLPTHITEGDGKL